MKFQVVGTDEDEIGHLLIVGLGEDLVDASDGRVDDFDDLVRDVDSLLLGQSDESLPKVIHRLHTGPSLVAGQVTDEPPALDDSRADEPRPVGSPLALKYR